MCPVNANYLRLSLSRCYLGSMEEQWCVEAGKTDSAMSFIFLGGLDTI